MSKYIKTTPTIISTNDFEKLCLLPEGENKFKVVDKATGSPIILELAAIIASKDSVCLRPGFPAQGTVDEMQSSHRPSLEPRHDAPAGSRHMGASLLSSR